MKKLLKGISLFGLSALAIFMFTAIVNANDEDENGKCTYTNYYFFSEINHADYDGFDGSEVVTATYFPGLEGTNIDYSPDNIGKGRICLKKNASGSGDGDNCGSEVWTLTEFYTKYIDTVKNGASKSDGKGSESKILKTTDANGNVVRYYVHGNWYKKDKTTGELVPQGGGVDVRNVQPSDLAKGSYLPDLTSVEISIDNEPNMATVTRKTSATNWNSVASSDVFTDGSWCGTTGCKMGPALYKITYKADCENPTPTPPKYKATINYYYEGTTNRVEFKNTSNKNPYTKSNLADGYTETKTSPEAANASCEPLEDSVAIEIQGKDFTHNVYYRCSTFNANIHYCIEKEDGTCIPATDVDKDAKDYSKTGLDNGAKGSVKSHTIKNCKLKKDDDKTVSYTIDNADFDYTVRYVCGEETAPVNPKTGIALIITAWAVGLGALGYSAYYFLNERKEENAEL